MGSFGSVQKTIPV